jgi:hypothetical protein
MSVIVRSTPEHFNQTIVRRNLIVERYRLEMARINELFASDNIRDTLQAEEIVCNLYDFLDSESEVVRAKLLLSQLDRQFPWAILRPLHLSWNEFMALVAYDEGTGSEGCVEDYWDDDDFRDPLNFCNCGSCARERGYII